MQSFWVCLILLSIISSLFIHVVADGRICFFFKDEQYSTIYIHNFFFGQFVHWWTLGYFYILTVVTKTALNTGVQMCWISPVWISQYFSEFQQGTLPYHVSSKSVPGLPHLLYVFKTLTTVSMQPALLLFNFSKS